MGTNSTSPTDGLRSLLGERLHLDWKIGLVTVVATLLLITDYYHVFTPDKGLDRTILYLIIPLLIIWLVFREDPRQYGLAIGDWRAGLPIVLISIALIAPVLWIVSRNPAMRQYYTPQLGGLPWNTFLQLFGWEFFFRGFILFAYARRFGHDALWLQAMPFALAHIGKPEIETLTTVFGGFAFGWMAYRTRSFLYPFLVHWFVASFVILVAAGALG
jgi:uncharacterized protein